MFKAGVTDGSEPPDVGARIEPWSSRKAASTLFSTFGNFFYLLIILFTNETLHLKCGDRSLGRCFSD